MTSPTVYRNEEVRGSLLDSNGIYSGDVLLDLRIAQLPGDGPDGAAIADLSITFGGGMPADGEYTVKYSWQNRPMQNKLRLTHQKPVVQIN
jgi:hypothetical protein